MVKYKCVKTQCPQCHITGSVQLFINKDGRLRYARTRHFSHRNKDTNKPQFTYCKIENLEKLKPLLQSLDISTSAYGQSGQIQKLNTHDPQLRRSSSNCQNMGAGSSVRIEHHPPKVGVVGSNPTPPVGDEPRTVLEIL